MSSDFDSPETSFWSGCRRAGGFFLALALAAGLGVAGASLWCQCYPALKSRLVSSRGQGVETLAAFEARLRQLSARVSPY